jgi:8-oxo-dGTP pyrophosphatase MutT (NUDIX family)
MNEDNFHLGIKALIRNSKGEYLLLKTNKARIDKEYYDIPGGRIKRGEDIINTLKREVFEETGIKISHCTPLNTSVEFFEGVAYYGYAFKADA